MDPQTKTNGGWRLLPWVLFLALAMRVLLALNTETVVHPDEALQYLEPAHRLVFKWGMIPWEYEYGVRSWIIPGFVAVILELLRAAGLAQPQVYDPVIKVVFCVLSLSLPLGVYRTAQLTVGERAARIAVVLSAFWYELLYYAHKPLADAVCAYVLFAALPLGLAGAAGKQRAIAFGALCGLAIALRFQMAPAVLILLAMAAARWRGRRLWALGGLAAVMAASGALDAYTWGVPFSSIWMNVRLNLFAHVADMFGAMPADYYLLELSLTSMGLALAGLAGLVLRRRTAWPLLAIGAAVFAAFSAIGHKEPRFVFALIPLYLIGVAALADWRPGAARWAPPVVVLLAAGVSACGLLWILPLEDRVYMAPLIGRDDVRDCYRFLSLQQDVTGVIDQTDDDRRLYGYFDLHQPAPIYRRDYLGTQLRTVLAAPQHYASHWILPSGSRPPAGYHALRRIGRFTVWRRDRDPAATLAPAGYSTRIGFARLRLTPEVAPRW